MGLFLVIAKGTNGDISPMLALASAWLRVCAAVVTLQEQTMGNHGIKIMRRYAYAPGVPALSSSRLEEGLQLCAVPQASVSLMAASFRWF